MEQRTEPSIEPEFTAGTDPADVPGLMGLRPTDAKEMDENDQEQEQEQAAERAPDGSGEAVDGLAASVPEKSSAPGGEAGPGEPDPGVAEDGASGPVFEVSDRRASITANRTGIHLRLDDQEAEFPWNEIGAVEIRLPRLGRWFTIEVHLLSRRWFDADVEATARSDLKKWEAELDAVLVAYLEGS